MFEPWFVFVGTLLFLGAVALWQRRQARRRREEESELAQWTDAQLSDRTHEQAAEDAAAVAFIHRAIGPTPTQVGIMLRGRIDSYIRETPDGNQHLVWCRSDWEQDVRVFIRDGDERAAFASAFVRFRRNPMAYPSFPQALMSRLASVAIFHQAVVLGKVPEPRLQAVKWPTDPIDVMADAQQSFDATIRFLQGILERHEVGIRELKELILTQPHKSVRYQRQDGRHEGLMTQRLTEDQTADFFRAREKRWGGKEQPAL